MQDEIITFTGRSRKQIEVDIAQLAPKLQEHRLQGRPEEAASAEYRLDRLYEELRAARCRDDNPTVDDTKRLTQALFLDGRRNGSREA